MWHEVLLIFALPIWRKQAHQQGLVQAKPAVCLFVCLPPLWCLNTMLWFVCPPAMTVSPSLTSPSGDESPTLSKHQAMRVKRSGDGTTTSRDFLHWGIQVQPRAWELLVASSFSPPPWLGLPHSCPACLQCLNSSQFCLPCKDHWWLGRGISATYCIARHFWDRYCLNTRKDQHFLGYGIKQKSRCLHDLQLDLILTNLLIRISLLTVQ